MRERESEPEVYMRVAIQSQHAMNYALRAVVRPCDRGACCLARTRLVDIQVCIPPCADSEFCKDGKLCMEVIHGLPN